MQMSTLVLLVWELKFSSLSLSSLAFLLLPVAERKGLSAANKAERCFLPLAIPTVPFSSEPGETLHTQDESGKGSDVTMNLIPHCLGKPVCQI